MVTAVNKDLGARAAHELREASALLMSRGEIKKAKELITLANEIAPPMREFQDPPNVIRISKWIHDHTVRD